MVSKLFCQGLCPKGDYMPPPHIQTNSRLSAYWYGVTLQPRQLMEIMARDLLKTTLFSSKGPQ